MSESVVIKLEYRGAIKRMRKAPSSLAELRKLIFECFPELASATITAKYRDKENDLISLSTEEDLQEAYLQLREEKLNALKLHIENLKEVQGYSDWNVPRTSNYPALGNPPAEENKGIAELNERMVNATISEEPKILQSTIENAAIGDEVACSGCLIDPITGDIYRCTACPNYNLCATCAASCTYPDHTLQKVRRPFNSRASPFLPLGAGNDFLLSMLPFGGLGNCFAGHGGRPQFAPGHQFWGGHCKGWRRKVRAKMHDDPTYHPHHKKAKKMGVVVGGREKRCQKITCAPGAICESKWQFKNESPWPWPANVTVSKKRGNIDFEPMPLQGGFQPNKLINLNIPIKAPSKPGTYKLKLALNAAEGYQIGKCLQVELKVAAAEPMVGMEEVLSEKARDMERAGLGTFERCYDALMAEKENPRAAKDRCKNP